MSRSPTAPPSRSTARHDSVQMYLAEVDKYPVLTPAQEREIATAAFAGDLAARDKLVNHNLRFAVFLANRYHRDAIPLADRIQAANFGLMRAAGKFDPSRDVKFTSYATHWIERYLLELQARQSYVAPLPLHRADLFTRIQKARAALSQRYNREPTLEELAAAAETTESMVSLALQYQSEPAELDRGGADEDGPPLRDRLASETDDADRRTLRRDRQERLLDAIQRLPDRQGEVLRYYFGLHNHPEKTLEEIGTVLGLTRERVRQLKDRGLEALRADPTIMGLTD